MKLNHAIILTAALLITPLLRAETSAALPAPLPELMNDEQAAKWSAAQEAAATTASANEPSNQFYTGKPYVADAGGYVYKYRTYSPEMSRWTSADPSGFPDGANNHVYAYNPTNSVDPDGLLTVTGTTTAASTTYTAGNTTYTITADNIEGFSTSNALSGTLDVTTYLTVGTGSGGLALYIEISVSGVPAQANTTYNFIQSITTSDPLAGQSSPYLDTSPSTTPFYPYSNASYFGDSPSRAATDATPGNPVTWESALEYAGENSVTGAITDYGGITYGFTITATTSE